MNENITEGGLKLVKTVIQDFLQALKIFQLYEADHPILQRFLGRLTQDFDGYFKKYDALIIQVDERHFLWDGKALYESRDIRESLAFMFFKDGIREIRFFKGLDQNEILDFLMIVKKSNMVNRMEDDLVTLLWDKDFVHIDFTVVDDFFEGSSILIPQVEEDLLRGLEYRGFEEVGMEWDDKKTDTGPGSGAGTGIGSGAAMGSTDRIRNKSVAGVGTGNDIGTRGGSGLGDGISAGKGAGAEIGEGTGLGRGTGGGMGNGTDLGKGAEQPAMGIVPSLVVDGLRQMLTLSADRSLAQVCALTPEEIEKIYGRAHKEEQLETLYALINNFTEILLHLGEDTRTYENIVSYFDRTVKSLLQEKQIQKAVAILENFQHMMSRIPLKEKQNNAVKRILQIASDGPSIELLGKAMEQNHEADWEPIVHYLELLTEKAIDPLCLLLETLEVDTCRRVIRERLAELCRGKIDFFAKFLSSPRVSFVSDLLYVLGKVGHPSTLKYLTNLAYHENSKIREEVLGMATVFEEGGKDLVQKFLKDPLPEMRGKAALIFGRIAKDQAIKDLLEIILAEDFYMRSYEEKISFFRALGETGSPETIPILEQIIKKKKWFHKEKWEEMRTCAVNTLKMIETRKE